MATQRQFKHDRPQGDTPKSAPKPLEAGRRPTDEAADQSPALALQAKLHTQLGPKTLELSSRFVTFLFALTIVGTWLATEAANSTL